LSPEISHNDTLLGPSPSITGPEGLITVLVALAIGTALLLVLIRFRQVRLWKVWFFISVFATISIALNVYIAPLYALIVALFLSYLKIFRSHVIIHNFTEILMYTGIAVLFASWFTLFWASILLILISIYDMFAVWKSKHMIKLAEFTMQSKLFAGVSIPYSPKPVSQTHTPPPSQKTAILGGGDIAFPLIFTSSVLKFILLGGSSLILSFSLSMIVGLTATLSLGALFYWSKKDRFYPAMPFISAGCFVGLGIVYILL